VKGKNLKVEFTPLTLLVQINGKDTIINGEFPERIHADGSVWTLETGDI